MASDAEVWPADQLEALNERLAREGIRLSAPAPDERGRWQVRIDCTGEPSEIIAGPTARAAWTSALAWLGSAAGAP